MYKIIITPPREILYYLYTKLIVTGARVLYAVGLTSPCDNLFFPTKAPNNIYITCASSIYLIKFSKLLFMLDFSEVASCRPRIFIFRDNYIIKTKVLERCYKKILYWILTKEKTFSSFQTSSPSRLFPCPPLKVAFYQVIGGLTFGVCM